MSLFVYCYNVFFVLLFTFTLSACFMTYGATGRKIFQYFGVLMFTYIVESIYLAIFEIFAVSTSGYFYPCSMILFSTVELYIIGKIIYTIFGKEKQRTLYVICLIAAAAAVCGLLLGNDIGLFLEMSMFSATLIAFCGIYWRMLRQETDSAACEDCGKYKALIGIMCIFSVLSIFENAAYIFEVKTLVDALFPFYGNQMNLFSDAFCVILSIWLVIFTQREREKYMSQKIEGILQQRMNEFQVYEQEKSKVVKKEQLVEFCEYYGLTERETEILRLILEGKTNQELSRELYITVGTVKAHVHSIFGKLEVTRRSQLMTMFMNYGKKG